MSKTNPAAPAALPGSTPPVPVSQLKFEAALANLESIIQSMEEGRLPLEESLVAYHRGVELLKHCQQQLDDAERRIQVLDQGVLRDFDETAGGRE
ncbi:MAG: exodeoxyribonuclease VII small subunit [Pseudomonadota bacterium]